MKALRTVLLGVLLASGVLGVIRFATPPDAFAQGMASGGGGGSDACTGADCVVTSLTASSIGAGVTAPKLTSTATSGADAIVIPGSRYIRMNGVAGAFLVYDPFGYDGTSTGAVKVGDAFGANRLRVPLIKFPSSSLGTCSASTEGDVRNDNTAGVATGAVTRLCLCASSGASVYAWRNLMTGATGTNTTCAP